MTENPIIAVKAVAANAASWAMTFSTIKLAEAGMVISILAGLGSVTVSIYTVRWIKQQMAVHKREHGPSE